MNAPANVAQRDAPFLILRVEPEGGKAEPIDVSDRVISFRYTDTEKKADKLSIVVENFDGAAWDEATFKKGNLLYLRWGYPGSMSPERVATITKATGGVEMQIEAQDKSVLMHRKTLSKRYSNVTRSDVVRQIAERNGFSGDALHIEDTTRIFDTIVQPNISDARMLKNLAHREGFEFFVDFDGLHWHTRRVDAAPTREFTYYNAEINDAAVLSYNVENDLTAKPAKTKLKGFNPRTKKPFEVTGSNADTKRVVLQEIVEVRDFETGKWVREVRSASEETKPTSEQDEDSAKRRADGRFRKISQRAVEMTISVLGDPLLLAKSVVIVNGIAKRLDGRYYIREVEHSISSGGYTCSLKLITDGSRGYRGVSVNDALFPASKSTKGTGDPYGAALALVNVLNDAQDAIVVGGNSAGLPASSLIGRLNGLDQRVSSDPGDSAAFEEARKAGQEILAAGSKSGDRSLINAGRAVVSAATRGKSASEAARSRGELNQRPLDTDRNALEAVERDPETQEWRPKR